MKLRKIVAAGVVTLVVAAAAGWFSLDKETRGLLATLPTNRDVLFWSQAQRDPGKGVPGYLGNATGSQLARRSNSVQEVIGTPRASCPRAPRPGRCRPGRR